MPAPWSKKIRGLNDLSDPDRLTIERARRGDRRALRGLVERYGVPLHRLASRIVGNADDAGDVVQETFLRAFRGLHRFNGRATFKTWITRIALNSCMTLLSQRSRAPQDLIESTTPMSSERPEAGIVSEEIHTMIARALDSLTPMERTAWVLRHEEGTPIAEVSRLLGVSNDAARQSISRAAQKLRRHLRTMQRGNR